MMHSFLPNFRRLVLGGAEELGMNGCADAWREFSRPICMSDKIWYNSLVSFWGGVPLNEDRAEDYGKISRSKGGCDLQEGFWRA